MKKLVALFVACACVLCLFSGCSDMSEIADNVLEAAREELLEQIQAKVEEYKVNIIETKTAVGKLNDQGGQYQFFCALLIQTNAESSAEDCAEAVAALAGKAAYMPQTGSQVVSEYLVHKTITYDQTDFSAGNYYTVYVYVEDLVNVVFPNGIPSVPGIGGTEGDKAVSGI
jgi:hypothetical protein